VNFLNSKKSKDGKSVERRQQGEREVSIKINHTYRVTLVEQSKLGSGRTRTGEEKQKRMRGD